MSVRDHTLTLFLKYFRNLLVKINEFQKSFNRQKQIHIK